MRARNFLKRISDLAFGTSLDFPEVSISSAAVELAVLKAPTDCGKPLEELRCTVAGAGTMGRLVLTHLASRGLKKVTF